MFAIPSPCVLRSLRNHLTLPRKRKTMVSRETREMPEIRDLIDVPAPGNAGIAE